MYIVKQKRGKANILKVGDLMLFKMKGQYYKHLKWNRVYEE